MFIFTGKITVLKALIPPFLRRIDTYLLLNHPLVWISRIHLVIFYGIITWSLSALSGLAIPIHLSQTQDLGLWYFLFSIVALVALCFWIYHTVIFNLEKKFGKRHWSDTYKVFFLNLSCAFIFISFPIPFTSIYNSRVANTVSDAEFIGEINALNAGECFVANNTGNYESFYDTTSKLTYHNFKNLQIFDSRTPWLLKYDTLNGHGLLGNYETAMIYRSAIGHEDRIRQIIRNYCHVWEKYGLGHYGQASEDSILRQWHYLYVNSPVESSLFYNIHHNYFNNYELDQIMNRIAEAKYQSLFIYDSEFLHFILYTCFYLSVLVMLFKMVPWRQFLLMVVACIILPIFLFILSQLMPRFDYSSRDSSYLFLLLATLAVAIIFTAVGFAPARQFNPFQNICAQITYVVLPMLPVIILLLCKMLFYEPDAVESYDTAVYAEQMPAPYQASNLIYNTWPYIYRQLIADYWRAWFEKWTLICLYGGLALFVLAGLPAMNHLFVRQLALPRRN